MNVALRQREVGTSGLWITELGFGGASVGNLYTPISDAEARDTITAALEQGIRYFDTAPYYGFGLSERRVGDGIRGCPDAVLSTKVGRLLVPHPSVTTDAERHGFRSSMPFEPAFDYSYDGIMRSFEASLQRLGLAKIDLLYVHDIGCLTHRARAASYFEQLTEGGGFRALEGLRAGGAVRAFGIGVNEIAVCLQAMEAVSLDAILLAGRYTLLEQDSLSTLIPNCAACRTSLVIGGPYNSGILATGTRKGRSLHYNYAEAPPAVVDRVRELERVCDSYDVPLPAAALQFPLAHPAVASVIPGLGGRERVLQTLSFYSHPIPAEFWDELKRLHLIHEAAPVPQALAA